MYKKCTFKEAPNGLTYPSPYGISDDKFYDLLEEQMTFCKVKGLTVKQAQILFDACKKYVADSTLV